MIHCSFCFLSNSHCSTSILYAIGFINYQMAVEVMFHWGWAMVSHYVSGIVYHKIKNDETMRDRCEIATNFNRSQYLQYLFINNVIYEHTSMSVKYSARGCYSDTVTWSYPWEGNIHLKFNKDTLLYTTYIPLNITLNGLCIWDMYHG